MKMMTSTRQVGGVTIVDISGRIELGEESAAVRDMVCDLLSKGNKHILLNLGDVHYIDSSGLGALVSSFASARKQGGELKLLNLTDRVTDLMQMTKLYTVFDVKNDEAVAVRVLWPIHSRNQLRPDRWQGEEESGIFRLPFDPFLPAVPNFKSSGGHFLRARDDVCDFHNVFEDSINHHEGERRQGKFARAFHAARFYPCLEKKFNQPALS